MGLPGWNSYKYRNVLAGELSDDSGTVHEWNFPDRSILGKKRIYCFSEAIISAPVLLVSNSEYYERMPAAICNFAGEEPIPVGKTADISNSAKCIRFFLRTDSRDIVHEQNGM